MDINKYAADKLKKLRMQNNLTQEELADKLNVTQQQIARYENNLRQFKQDFIYKLAKYFDVSINYFFPNNEDPSLDDKDKELIQKISSLSNNQKNMLYDFINLINDKK